MKIVHFALNYPAFRILAAIDIAQLIPLSLYCTLLYMHTP